MPCAPESAALCTLFQVKAEFETRPEAPLTPPPSPDTTPVLESVECMSVVAIPGAEHCG